MRLEEYLKKRKEEDGINEYDIEKREENAQICAKYVQEYFNDYLNTTEEKRRQQHMKNGKKNTRDG